MSAKTIKILKITGITIGVLVLLIIGAVFIVDTDFHVERSVTVERPVDKVFDYVKYLRNQDQFSVWGERDPDMRQEFRGTDGTVGFVSAWQGNEDVGSGEQEIIGLTEGLRIDYELRFLEPFESTSQSYMTTEPLGENRTRITWGMSGSFPRPMNLMLLFFDMDEALGSDFENGLGNLEAILEQDPISH